MGCFQHSSAGAAVLTEHTLHLMVERQSWRSPQDNICSLASGLHYGFITAGNLGRKVSK